MDHAQNELDLRMFRCPGVIGYATRLLYKSCPARQLGRRQNMGGARKRNGASGKPTSGYRPSSHQPNWSSYYKGGGTANTTAWDGRQSMFEGSTDGEMRPRMRGMKHASPEPTSVTTHQGSEE